MKLYLIILTSMRDTKNLVNGAANNHHSFDVRVFIVSRHGGRAQPQWKKNNEISNRAF